MANGFLGDVDRGEKAGVIHHGKALSVFAVGLARIVLPFPNGMIGVGHPKGYVESPEYIGNPTHLRTRLEKNDLNLIRELDEQVKYTRAVVTSGIGYSYCRLPSTSQIGTYILHHILTKPLMSLAQMD